MPQSSELAGGEGFTYEGDAAAFYMASLLAEVGAPGIEDRVVHQVAVQQRDFGEPLDDVIVDFRSETGEIARLSLQVKRSLTISAATSNADFRDIIRDASATLAKPSFRKKEDRYGVVAGMVTPAKARALTTLCELARESVDAAHFAARFATGGNAGPSVKTVRNDIVTLLTEMMERPPSDIEVHQFLAHFVLVQFDFLHEGAVDPPAAIANIRNALAAPDIGKAPLVWSKIVQLARNSAGKSGVFDRARLVRAISAVARLSGAPRFRNDIEHLSDLAASLARNIPDDVSGTRLLRNGLVAKVDAMLQNFRVVQIRGLPGSGKSVLLKRCVERALSAGPALFLRGDQLEGRSWRAFATTLGLSGGNLRDLLVEIAATGTGVLFVDAIDRVEKEHQPIILELLRTIIEFPVLDNWQIVLSLRDTGIEPIRNWMGEFTDSAGVGTVDVGTLSDEEAELLATDKPHIRSLLFGPSRVREIVRRPFFAKILDQGFAADATGSLFIPQSEVDLIENWWERGGYDAAGRSAIERQRAIVELATVRARNLSQPIKLNQINAACIVQVSQLIEDGILQQARKGHSVRFAHDIFFEWGYFHALADRSEDWLDEVRSCGEPPAVARVVELFSQSEYTHSQEWAGHLSRAAASGMRSQWTRSWLLGPVGAADFAQKEDQFAAAAAADDFHFLKKALVWFQAEKTTPNRNILAGNLSKEQQLRIADLLGWPSDFAAWERFISFLLRRIEDVPTRLYPDILSVFEVWQNALKDVQNPLSRSILVQCAKWLEELDIENKSKGRTNRSAIWGTLPQSGDFRKSLVTLILRSAMSEPSFTEDYLKRKIASESLREERFVEIIPFSPTLARTHPVLLVELTLKHLRKELPDERVAREEEEAHQSSERRRRALAKPEDERTREDQLAVQGTFSWIGHHQFDYRDWERLSLDCNSRNFWPASPLREPFHSLFQSAPDEALRLLRELCNFAMTAWRQLHHHVRDSHGTPLPLELTFTWGAQTFWGGDREYCWFRNAWVPKPIGCAFMALEGWCFSELDRGTPADALIERIVRGNECIAILGVAAMIALHDDTISDTVLPLVTSQRLLVADRNRLTQDLTPGSVSFFGFDDRSDQVHIEAIQAAEARSVRKKHLEWHLQRFFMVGGEAVASKVQVAVRGFKSQLPFEYEEHRNVEAVIDDLTAQAMKFEELVQADNYRAYQTEEPGQVAIVYVSPSASDPEQVAKTERAKLDLQEVNLWAWGAKAFETDALGAGFTVRSALELARTLDAPDLFEKAEQEDDGTRRGAVAAAAAIVLRYRDEARAEDLVWARQILRRAIAAPEHGDAMWPAGAIIPWHHGAFTARGLAADLAAGTAEADTPENLLGLVAHPLEVVSLASLEEASRLWNCDPRMSWAALYLAFTLCHVAPMPRDRSRGPSEPIHSSAEISEAVNAAVKFYRDDSVWPELPLPPPAWIKMSEAEAKGQVYRRFGEDETRPKDGSGEVWAEPRTFWHDPYADKILSRIPLDDVCRSQARGSLLDFASSLLGWTNQKNQPPWVKSGRRDQTASSLFEWTHGLGKVLGRMSGLMSLDEVRDRFLAPISALEGKACWSVLAPFVDSYICSYVLDAPIIPDGAFDILGACLERFLAAPELDPDSYRSGEFSGFDQPRLAQHLMFISVERSTLAARYVNGDWTEIDRIEPIVDRYVRVAGWAASVMGSFLTLCERAKENYRADAFADQVLATLLETTVQLKGWHGTLLPARIAGLVQHFADRDSPLPLPLAQKFLRILDLLVDMGDRRSAALQYSEAFREIRVAK
ncbi:ATP-binding protein [Asaia sp. As-1742]|nr:ATP-binding protein [Asaia sp. As-1742]